MCALRRILLLVCCVFGVVTRCRLFVFSSQSVHHYVFFFFGLLLFLFLFPVVVYVLCVVCVYFYASAMVHTERHSLPLVGRPVAIRGGVPGGGWFVHGAHVVGVMDDDDGACDGIR